MSFSENTIEDVWKKGITVEGYNPELYRQDVCEAWMMRTEYDNMNSALGWQIDRVLPLSKGGGDDLVNLRPMQHQNKASKSDDYPIYKGVITSEESKVITEQNEYTVRQDLQDKLTELYLNK